jgi:dienelactone hydrolase
MGRLLTATIILSLVAPFALPAFVEAAQPKLPPPDETLNVPSLTLTDEQFLRGDKANGVPVTLTGELRFPNWDEHLPAVVLLHGSDGPTSGSALQWREYLNKIGIVTLRLDSFSGRGKDQTATDQSQLSLFAQIYDTYRAIDVLAVHPRIDPSRIAVMGFSRGGFATLYSSMRRFQDLYGPGATKIAAYMPFYPLCTIHLIGELDVADAPIREFHGTSDDWTPATPCRDFITHLKPAGKDALLTEYPGARHSFDDPSNPPRYVVQNAQTSRNCRRREEDGKIINIETGKPFSYNDACVELGPTVGYDKAATEAAQVAVKEFLIRVFRLN